MSADFRQGVRWRQHQTVKISLSKSPLMFYFTLYWESGSTSLVYFLCLLHKFDKLSVYKISLKCKLLVYFFCLLQGFLFYCFIFFAVLLMLAVTGIWAKHFKRSSILINPLWWISHPEFFTTGWTFICSSEMEASWFHWFNPLACCIVYFCFLMTNNDFDGRILKIWS